METIEVFCECESFDCAKLIKLPFDTAMEIAAITPKAYVIVDDCQVGPNETDVLYEKREGYSLYRES